MSSTEETAREKKMLPCPFCGDASPEFGQQESLGRYFFWITCINCTCQGPEKASKAAAVKVWNTRSGAAGRAEAAKQDWCDHCSADLNGIKHTLCEKCYGIFAGPKLGDPDFDSTTGSPDAIAR